jgi:hypothetical protein
MSAMAASIETKSRIEPPQAEIERRLHTDLLDGNP